MARTVKVRRQLLEQVKEILETDSDSDAINEGLLEVVRRQKVRKLHERLFTAEVSEVQAVWDQGVREIYSSS